MNHLSKVIAQTSLLALPLLIHCLPVMAETPDAGQAAASGQIDSEARNDNSTSFLPVWRLLSQEQKQQFVSGYLHGWQDAAIVIGIAISYVRENPGNAVEGLKKIQAIYNLSSLKPDTTTQAIDEFYSNPANSRAPLSMAITAARNKR